MPPYAFHCDSCQHCVRHHDHHCFFTNNCLGPRNLFNVVLCSHLGLYLALLYFYMYLLYLEVMLDLHTETVSPDEATYMFYGYIVFLVLIPLMTVFPPAVLGGIGIYGYTCYLQMKCFHAGSLNPFNMMPYIYVLWAMGLFLMSIKNLLLYHWMVAVEMTLPEF